MEHNKTATGNQTKKKYRIADRFLPTSGALEWPLFFTIVRRVLPKPKTVKELTEEGLLSVYAPVGVLVDQLGNIRYVHGHTGLFLEPAQGYTGVNNVLKMARKKLRRDLNTTLYHAVTSRSAVNSPIVSIKRNGETMGLMIRVIPLLKQASLGQVEDFYLLIFEPQPGQKEAPAMDVNRSKTPEPLPVSPELIALNQEINSKTAELSSINTELENTRMELEISRNKLHAVKATINGSETELQVLVEKIQDSKDELEIIGEELLVAKNELEANLAGSETITLDRLPIREELDNIKNDLLIANQALEEKREMLEELDSIDKTPSSERSIFDQNEVLELDTAKPIDEETTFEINEAVAEEPESWDYQQEQDPFSADLPASVVNENEIGYFSKTEPKPYAPQSRVLSFGNEPDPVDLIVDKTELLFKDAAAFQAAASHGYRHDNEIKAVYIPEGVEVIKRSMFYKCTQLETATFPSTLKAIEDFAFYGCEALKTIDLDKCKVLEIIGTSAFEGCKSMTGLVIPEAVINIEEAAFLGCQELEAVEFYGNSQLEVLGSHVFKDCVQIKKIILPDQLKHIGISCFYGCQNLIEIHLPKELETVGEYAFFGCNALEEIGFSNKKILKQPGFSVGFPEGVKL
ncbi:leucine-rich repeat protein [Acetobacterium sp.]|uniref:leucine-rich repeat protein n=1 Tax=Acetobacterium sp. TaxID=1872094 RepID=UPI0035942107